MRRNASQEISRLLTVVIAIAVVAALYLGKAVLLPLALALLFAFLLSPLVFLLEKVRVPRIVAILLVIVSVFVLACGIGWGIVTQVLQITDHLPTYRANITAKIDEFHHTKSEDLDRARSEIERLGQELGLSDSPADNLAGKPLGSSPDHPVDVREVSNRNGAGLGFLPGALGAMVETLLVVVFTLFMLLQREDLRNRLLRLTGRGELNVKTQALNEASKRVSRYFVLLLAVNTAYGAIIFVALHLLGLPHALLFGALTALLRFVPYVGAPLSGLLPITLSLAVFPGWEQSGIILGVFICVEIMAANYIEPRLYGKHTGVSPLAILVAAVFWTLIWGPIGLLLSVPLTVCLAVIGSHVPKMKFLIVLLGDEPVLLPSVHFYQRLLAHDGNEARAVLETYIKEKPLEDLYDSVVIPALGLAEQDRHQDDLDEATVSFIERTTKELVDEMALRHGKSNGAALAASEGAGDGEPERMAAGNAGMGIPHVARRKIVCVPVRDDADEIAAMMLCHLLERAGHSAQVIPIQNADGMVAEVARLRPDMAYLSVVPPYGMSHARKVYGKLRAELPKLAIAMGFWNYTDDGPTAAREISRGEQEHFATTLAQAVALAGTTASANPVAIKNVAEQLLLQG